MGEMKLMLDIFRCPIDGSRFVSKWKCEKGHEFKEIDGIINFLQNQDVEGDKLLETIAPIYEPLWAPLGFLLTSHVSYSGVLRNISNYLNGNVVVDVGTGTGKVFDYVNCEVCIGMDISFKFLKILSKKRNKVIPVRADVRSIPLQSEVADAVSALLVIHMLPSKLSALKEIFRILKHKGRFVSIILTNNNSISRLLAKWWKIELYSTDYYIKLFREIGFEEINYKKMGAWTLFTCAKP